MARKKGGLAARRTSVREYRDVCWVSAEGTTERDYLGMAAFKGAPVSVRFPKNTHSNRHNPAAVLKRFEKALPAPGMTDAHLLVERLLAPGGGE